GGAPRRRRGRYRGGSERLAAAPRPGRRVGAASRRAGGPADDQQRRALDARSRGDALWRHAGAAGLGRAPPRAERPLLGRAERLAGPSPRGGSPGLTAGDSPREAPARSLPAGGEPARRISRPPWSIY